MSFGNRQRDHNDDYVQLEPSEYEAASWRKLRVQAKNYQDPAEISADVFARGVRLGVLVMMLLVMTGVTIYFLSNRNNVFAFDVNSDHYIKTGTIEFVMSSPVASNGVNDIDATVNSFCLDYQQWGNRRELFRPSSVVTDKVSIALNPEEAVTYLVCGAKLRLARFCHPFYRKRFADRAKQVLASLKIKETYAQAHIARSESVASDFEVNGGEPLPKIVKVRQEFFTPLHNRIRFIRAVNDLIRKGGLTKSDFGWGGLTVPEEFSMTFDKPRQLKFCS